MKLITLSSRIDRKHLNKFVAIMRKAEARISKAPGFQFFTLGIDKATGGFTALAGFERALSLRELKAIFPDDSLDEFQSQLGPIVGNHVTAVDEKLPMAGPT